MAGCSVNNSVPAADSSETAGAPSTASAQQETIAPQTIYDANGIKVDMTEFGSYLGEANEGTIIAGDGVWMKFSIENGSGSDIHVESILASVNDVMIQPMRFSTWVAAGQTSTDATLSFDYGDLKRASIKQVGSISFILAVIDSSTWDAIDVKYITLHSTLGDANQLRTYPPGRTLLDQGGVKVCYYDNEYDGQTYYCKLYIENDTDKTVSVRLDGARADGVDVAANTYPTNCDLFPGTVAYGQISVQTADKGYAGPDSIRQLAGTLNVSRYDDGSSTIASADVALDLSQG